MKITIVGIDFDYHDYDERGDVLFLHVEKPKEPPAKAFETPEGHTVEYDDRGAVVGPELVGVRQAVESGVAPQLTLPQAKIAASSLQAAITA
ncbi:MAG: hypothetical protein ACTHM1_08790 [Solirubrobacteraceae bacterium]